jgi:two-component system sensor histidine kinase/response regulator
MIMDSRCLPILSKALVDYTPVNVFVWDVWPNYTTIVYANEATATTFGLPLAEVVGTDPMTTLLAPSDQPFWRDFLMELERERVPISNPWQTRLNGDRVYLQCCGAFEGIMNNGASRFTFMCENISKLKYVEVKLEELLFRQESEITEKLKMDFALSLSHEIRTPVNGILGYTNMMLDKTLDVDQKEYLQIIRKSSENLLEIVKNVLEFAKLDTKKMELNERVFDLEEALESAAELMLPMANEKGLRLGFFIDSDVPCQLRGDSVRLIQTLVNLIDNSLNRTTEGYIVVRVRRALHAPSKPALGNPDDIMLEFIVEDTGSGLSSEEQAYLSRPLFKALDNIGGNGIGLALSKNFIEMTGGKIWAEHGKSQGSRLCFTLKLSEYCVPADKSALSNSGTILSKTGLVISDNELSQATLCHHLTRLGIQTNVGCEEDLLSAIHADPYDVLILDLQPTTLQSLLRNVRHDWTFANMKKVIVTHPQHPKVLDSPSPFNHVTFISQPISRKKLKMSLAVTPLKPVCPSPSGGPRFDGLNALVAEDNEVNQKIVVTQLQSMGFVVKVANNGKEAVDAFKKEPSAFSLILMDLQMPLMSGLDACSEIRKFNNAVGRHVPVVAFTASYFPEMAFECKKVGMDGFLQKPVTKRDLEKEIKRVIDGNK